MARGPIFCPDSCCGTPGIFDCYGNSDSVGQIIVNGLYRTPVRWPDGLTADELSASDGDQYTSIDEGWFIAIDTEDPDQDTGQIVYSLVAQTDMEHVHLLRSANPDHPDADVASSPASLNAPTYGPDAEFQPNYKIVATDTATTDAYKQWTFTSGLNSSSEYRLTLIAKYENWQYIIVELENWQSGSSSETTLIDLLNGTSGDWSIDEIEDGRLLCRLTNATTSPSSPKVRIYLARDDGSSTLFNGTSDVSSASLIQLEVRESGVNTGVFDTVHFKARDSDYLFSAINYARVDRYQHFDSEYTDALLASESPFYAEVVDSENDILGDAPPITTQAIFAPNSNSYPAGGASAGFPSDRNASGRWGSGRRHIAWPGNTDGQVGNWSINRCSCNDEYFAAWYIGDSSLTAGDVLRQNHVLAFPFDPADDPIWDIGLNNLLHFRHSLLLDVGEGSGTIAESESACTWPDVSIWNNLPQYQMVQAIPPQDFPKCFAILYPRQEQPPDSGSCFQVEDEIDFEDVTFTPSSEGNTVKILFGDYGVATHGFLSQDSGSAYTLCSVSIAGFLDGPVIQCNELTATTFWSNTKSDSRAITADWFTQNRCGEPETPGPTDDAYVLEVERVRTPATWAQLVWADSINAKPGAIFTWGEVDVTLNADTAAGHHNKLDESYSNVVTYIAVKIGSTVVYEEEFWRDGDAYWDLTNISDLYVSGLRAVRDSNGDVYFVWFEKLWSTAPTSGSAGTPASVPWRLHYCRASDGTDDWTLDGGDSGEMPWCVGSSDEHIYVKNFLLCDDRFTGGAGEHDEWVISHDGEVRWPASVDDATGTNNSPKEVPHNSSGTVCHVRVDFVKNNATVTLSPEREQWDDAVCS